MKGWVGTGAPKYMSTMADSKKGTDNTEHVNQKTNPRAQAPEVCEKSFFHLFRSSANRKYNLSNMSFS